MLTTSCLLLAMTMQEQRMPAVECDLTKIPRTILKGPTLLTKVPPRYCLLVFGPNAATRIWLVADGMLLHIDRNANGNLAETDEQV